MVIYIYIYAMLFFTYRYTIYIYWLSLIQAVSKCGWWGHELKARDTTIIFAVSIAYSQCIYIIIYERKKHECDDEHLNLSEPFALMFSISSNQWLTVSHSEMARTRRFTMWGRKVCLLQKVQEFCNFRLLRFQSFLSVLWYQILHLERRLPSKMRLDYIPSLWICKCKVNWWKFMWFGLHYTLIMKHVHLQI